MPVGPMSSEFVISYSYAGTFPSWLLISESAPVKVRHK